MMTEEPDQHLDAMNQFINLANELKNNGTPTHIVSWGMMTASAVYATFSVAGNTGGLNASGVDKVVETYRQCLDQVQEARKKELENQGAEIRNEN
ncbi:hypothetical protein NOR51B_1676 [Luminiphilus syltensis NOR5-1B]|uniref:DUF3144 domain-containing protein n=1 Tax=Luminiphilus syltensis NOR5-1B TaxID=565045 RepID=B8KXB9_9GAMM|nr:DUF3144 domain-containing protein [Luminiphilus syltensis]EED35729.1 hypothetical protein NOR51B_1676 [Luminiphilus syltensis NOR5-1B]